MTESTCQVVGKATQRKSGLELLRKMKAIIMSKTGNMSYSDILIKVKDDCNLKQLWKCVKDSEDMKQLNNFGDVKAY